jgi:hypothetical protein
MNWQPIEIPPPEDGLDVILAYQDCEGKWCYFSAWAEKSGHDSECSSVLEQANGVGAKYWFRPEPPEVQK